MNSIPTLRRTSAIIIALLALVILCACNGKHNHRDDDEDDEEDKTESTSALKIDDELLNSFDPNVPFEQTGHSHPFRIRPREDITVSAGAGAFEQDVNISVTDVPAATMERLDRQLEGSGTTMIFAYDLDAGLPPDSVIPGKYTVSIDLRKHDIPKELYPYFTMYRVAGDGSLQPLNVKIDGHTATYQASQNSITLGAICIYTLATVAIAIPASYILARFPAITQTIRRAVDFGLWREWDDAVYLRVPDDFGSFYIAYRFSMTEKASQTSEYVQKKKELIKLEKQMRKEANEKYDSEHPQRFRGWFDSKEEEEKRRIGRDLEYYNLLSHSPRVQELSNDPLFDTPQSVDDIITATKLANRFCRAEQHMKPLSYEYVIFLSPDAEALGEEAFCHKTILIDPCVIVNYEMIVDYINHNYNRSEYWTTLPKLAHEIMHLYQYEYLVSTAFKDNCYLEASGALVEPHFIDWLIKTGKVSGIPVTNAFSPEAGRELGYSSRASKELLSSPLGKECPSYKDVKRVQHERGYMLADMMQYLWDHQPNPRDTLDFDKMTNRYSYHKGILKTMQDVFGIDGDAAFTKYYEGFCEKYIAEIARQQEKYRKKMAGDGLVMSNQVHTPERCVMRVKNLGEKGGSTGYPFMINTFCMIAKPASGQTGLQGYNLFAVPSKIEAGEMKFTFFKGNDFSATPMYFKADSAGSPCKYVYAAVMSRPNSKGLAMGSDYYYDIVALYQPTATPEVKGTSFDRRGLKVMTKCTPSEELMAKEYVTGMQVVMKNNKSGQMQSFIVKTKDWKKEFVAPFSQIGISDTTDIDLSLRSRWYYESPQGQRYCSPLTDIVNYRRQRDRVQQVVEEDSTQVEPDTEVVGSEDTGIGSVIDTDFFLVEWGGEIPCPIEGETSFEGNMEVKGHLTVRPDGSFSVMFPAFNGKIRQTNGRDYMDYSFPAVYIDGKGQYESSGSWARINNVIIPPQTFQYNMSGFMSGENGHANFRYRIISSEGAALGVTLTDDGKMKSFELRIPDTRLSAAGAGNQSGSGQTEEITRAFKLQGMAELPIPR